MRITKEPEIRRMEIVGAAKTLFEELGVERTSMAKIAQKAKVTKGLVYYYFSSKEELVEAVVEGLAMETDRMLMEILEDEKQDFLEKLSNILGLYFGVIRKNATLMALSNTNPGVFELVKNKLVESAIYHTKDLISQGMKEGVLQIEYPEYTLKILIGGIADLYQEGMEDPKVMAVLIEQVLSLPKGTLQIL
ncbi:TetR/AcrR family transcriptional regulator [Alkalibacter rhizosphaerae]|uniref:TetR/AcrR family transcriptional regulator n=1 Tax=Alkalibacter rhizosphaerae TaxID=2815577 RepID=A0A974XIL4_9FIRM|nr:TetR/AcrR family transcriptional regulator [Alkalibacter rhizosphaerae]QSX09380.1 TetR/AcrR family transcriptional regulator [Alkalibacter rhizosphaerae]